MNTNIIDIDKLNIELDSFLENNPGKDLPYHNNTHMQGVYNLAKFLKERPLTNYESACLAIASKLHDYGHSGGKLPDADNISVALKAVETFMLINDYTDETFIADVKELLSSTQFPHNGPAKNYLEGVLRDADLLDATYYLNVEAIMEGLRMESGITYEEMYKRQVGFNQNIKLHTELGESVHAALGRTFLDMMKDYVTYKGVVL